MRFQFFGAIVLALSLIIIGITPGILATRHDLDINDVVKQAQQSHRDFIKDAEESQKNARNDFQDKSDKMNKEFVEESNRMFWVSLGLGIFFFLVATVIAICCCMFPPKCHSGISMTNGRYRRDFFSSRHGGDFFSSRYRRGRIFDSAASGSITTVQVNYPVACCNTVPAVSYSTQMLNPVCAAGPYITTPGIPQLHSNFGVQQPLMPSNLFQQSSPSLNVSPLAPTVTTNDNCKDNRKSRFVNKKGTSSATTHNDKPPPYEAI